MAFLRPNKIIKYLILSDLAFWTGWGLLTPVFAIFVVGKIEGGSAFVVGVGSAVFWVVRSLLRVPFGVFVDAYPGARDDYFVLIAGLLLAGGSAFGYTFASLTWHIYVLQGLHGMALAMMLAGRTGLFTRNIDKGQESTEWGINGTVVGLGLGLAGAVGGWAVTRFGFDAVFVAVGIFSIISALVLFGLRKEMKGIFDNGLSKVLSSPEEP